MFLLVGFGRTSDAPENYVEILRNQGPSLKLSLAVPTIYTISLPDIWFRMEISGSINFILNPYLILDIVKGFIPLMTELTRRDIDILHAAAVRMLKVSKL